MLPAPFFDAELSLKTALSTLDKSAFFCYAEPFFPKLSLQQLRRKRGKTGGSRWLVEDTDTAEEEASKASVR